jgi:glutaredoxin 3
MEIKVYTTPTCPWCQKVKDWLKQKNVSFEEINVIESDSARDEMIQKSGQMGVPVIDVNGEIVIGFNEAKLEEALKKDSKEEEKTD